MWANSPHSHFFHGHLGMRAGLVVQVLFHAPFPVRLLIPVPQIDLVNYHTGFPDT